MTHEPDMDDLGEEVNQRALEMMEELEEHFQQLVEMHPEVASRRDEVFQGWAIQKMAGMQLSIEELAHRLNDIADLLRGPMNN